MEVKVLFFGVLAEVSGTQLKHYHDVKSISDLKLRIYDDFSGDCALQFPDIS